MAPLYSLLKFIYQVEKTGAPPQDYQDKRRTVKMVSQPTATFRGFYDSPFSSALEQGKIV